MAHQKNRIALRNRVAEFLNTKPILGCKVHAGPVPGAERLRGKREDVFSRLVTGTAKDGRTIALYPCIHTREMPPIAICLFLQEVEMRGGIAGTVTSIGDAWDCVVDNPAEYKRKKNTFLHQYKLKIRERKSHGESEE